MQYHALTTVISCTYNWNIMHLYSIGGGKKRTPRALPPLPTLTLVMLWGTLLTYKPLGSRTLSWLRALTKESLIIYGTNPQVLQTGMKDIHSKQVILIEWVKYEDTTYQMSCHQTTKKKKKKMEKWTYENMYWMCILKNHNSSIGYKLCFRHVGDAKLPYR